MSAGIYVHIPFCLQRCSYCSFYSTTSLQLRHDYVAALRTEAEKRTGFFDSGDTVSTLYFGGGTPSVLGTKMLGEIFSFLKNDFDLSKVEEFTVECNPDDIDGNFAENLLETGVNRISMGIQSFDDEELKMLSRRHNVEKAVKAVEICRNAGFDNISIDLMYGLPGQSLEKWEYSIGKALQLDVQHISAYCLSFEKNTPIYKFRNKAADDELAEKMYYTLCDRLKENHFEHYEISNFALENRRSKHNSAYWHGNSYLGLGPGAHSYDKKCRRWNIADLRQYIKSAEKGGIVFESEILSEKDKYNELLLTVLRTMEGLNKNDIGQRFASYFSKNAEKFLKSGDLVEKNGFFFLNEKTYFMSDYIIRELMF